MIAARLAGGNLFFAFFVVEDFFGGDFWERSEQRGALGALGFFLRGSCGGGFWEHSEQLGALGFFLRGFCWGDSFFWGVGGCFGL